jgi:hypothetical protein
VWQEFIMAKATVEDPFPLICEDSIASIHSKTITSPAVLFRGRLVFNLLPGKKPVTGRKLKTAFLSLMYAIYFAIN